MISHNIHNKCLSKFASTQTFYCIFKVANFSIIYILYPHKCLLQIKSIRNVLKTLNFNCKNSSCGLLYLCEQHIKGYQHG